MSFKKAYDYLKKYNLEDRVKCFKQSTKTVSEAADAVGVDECLIAKSMAYIVGNRNILILLNGNRFVDNKKFKKIFDSKAKMCDIDKLEERFNHKMGGVCPFGVNDDVEIYFDIHLKDYDYVYPACGSENSSVKLSIEELLSITKNKGFIDVTK
ncbi:MAG: YbaK/EbsC family protein [Tissierellia bacterium]|nr:YbaK/EbsC family protein [Tissierellia bacterium]